MMIEPSIYLSALLRDFISPAGAGRQRISQPEESCACLSQRLQLLRGASGARALFNDQKLGPVRGQLEV